jgi:hypothetical protein
MLVLDDNDAILKDKEGMALIMKATEKQVKREVTSTKILRNDVVKMMNIPPVFKTSCPVAILTNTDFELAIRVADNDQKTKGKLPPEHIKRWKAIMSRGQMIDLQLNTPRAVRVFCEHKIHNVKMLTNSAYLTEKFGRSLTADEEKELLKWVRFNQGKLSSALDLRTYIKVAEVMLKRKNEWQKSAEVRFLRSAA